ncbi:MAG: type I-U CRISPR-associated protein Cas5/Cas6, partial [Thermoleophilia bacterium]
WEEIARQGVVLAGYPEPCALELRRGAAVAGVPELRPVDRKRRPAEPNRPWSHLVLEFPSPLRGPLLLGHMRFLGLGLCVPEGRDG